MSEQYARIFEIPMRDADLQSHQYSTLTREWTNTHADLFKASRKRDKILLLLIVLQFICLSVAVASIIHFYGKTFLIFQLEDKLNFRLSSHHFIPSDLKIQYMFL